MAAKSKPEEGMGKRKLVHGSSGEGHQLSRYECNQELQEIVLRLDWTD
jgi:hypothetical protein